MSKFKNGKYPKWVLGLCVTGAVAAGVWAILTITPKELPSEPEIPPTTTESDVETQATQETTIPVVEEIQLPWNLILVNPWNRIPEDFSVELAELEDGQQVDERIYPDLERMMADMGAEGLQPLICSSYRTDEKQQTLYRNKVSQYLDKGYSLAEADAAAGKWVAVPGTSEHQTGLALDIIDTDYPYLDEAQEDTAVQKWLMAHSWEYGFILRYSREKSEITGINYEPWHYRYVGKEAAKEIFQQGICLEEYLEK